MVIVSGYIVDVMEMVMERDGHVKICKMFTLSERIVGLLITVLRN